MRGHFRSTTPCMIYFAYCTKCSKQGFGSTENRKPRLAIYNWHITNKIKSYSILRHFTDFNSDSENPSKYLKFVLIHCFTNIENKTKDQIDDLLLGEQNFWTGTLFLIHKGLNDYHDWRRIQRNQKFDIRGW